MLKQPFVNSRFLLNVIQSARVTTENMFQPFVTSVTHSRSTTVLKSFVGHRIGLYNGKKVTKMNIEPHMVGFKLGQFIFTKKMGVSIHNSIKNAKKKEKLRRKITEKKIRKGVPNVARSKKAKAKAIAQKRMKQKKENIKNHYDIRTIIKKKNK